MTSFTQRLHLRSGLNLLAVAATVSALSGLTGCGLGTNLSTSPAAPVSAGVATASGSVHGGQQPVAGATIQLYAAGIPVSGSGYGVGASTLLTSPVTTDANGNFSITGKYTCPTPTQNVYLVATGGNPGVGATVNSTALAEMTAIGPCPAGSNLLASLPFLQVSEITTVSAVWALQQFMAAPAAANKFAPNIGAPTTSYATGTTVGAVQSGVIGMNNAFTTARVMADITTSFTPNPNYPNAYPESSKINTLADILSSCINSDPSTTANCSQLFAAATPTGATTATDTIQAAWYMAQNPINNIATLYNLIPATAPYQPTYLAPMTAATGSTTAYAQNSFNDTTLAISYAPVTTAGTTCTNTTATTCAVSDSASLAIDAYGNVWVANLQTGINSAGTNLANIVELGTDGSLLTTPVTSFTVSSTGGSAPQFTTIPPTTHTVTTPKGIAVDLYNQAWFANQDVNTGTTSAGSISTSSVGILAATNASGTGGTGATVPTASGYFVGGLPFGLAIDGANNVFVENSAPLASTTTLDPQSLAKIVGNTGAYTWSSSASTLSPYVIPEVPSTTAGYGNAALAIDNNASGQIVWVASYQACRTKGQYEQATTAFGLISEFADSNDQPLADSEIASTYANPTLGVGSSTNCNNSSSFIGQIISAATAQPSGIAIDRNNGVWISDELTTGGTIPGFDGLTYLTAPTSNVGAIPTSLTLTNGGAPPTTVAANQGTGLQKPAALAVDGNNNVWASSATARSLSEASYAIVNGTPTITLLTPGQGSAYGTLSGGAYGLGFVHQTQSSSSLGIDPSGNIWLVNTNAGTGVNFTAASGTLINIGNTVTVIVGAAGPVVTPLSLSIKSNKLGAKP